MGRKRKEYHIVAKSYVQRADGSLTCTDDLTPEEKRKLGDWIINKGMSAYLNAGLREKYEGRAVVKSVTRGGEGEPGTINVKFV